LRATSINEFVFVDATADLATMSPKFRRNVAGLMSQEIHEMIVGYIQNALDEAITRIEYAKTRTTMNRDQKDTELINEYIEKIKELKENVKISEN